MSALQAGLGCNMYTYTPHPHPPQSPVTVLLEIEHSDSGWGRLSPSSFVIFCKANFQDREIFLMAV